MHARRVAVTAAWLAVALLGAACSRPPRAERVVLITIDTLRADHVTPFGGPEFATPQLERLAERGTRFETAISPAPLTLPSHTSILTGLDPPHHGIHHNTFYRLPDDVPTVAEAMRAQGMATAAFVSAIVLEKRFGLDRGFDRYDDQMAFGRNEELGGFAERPADKTVDAALAWLADAPSRFFLWVHLYDPHAPYLPPKRHAEAYPDDPYLGEIHFADAEAGRLIDAVEARYPDGGTLVLVTSDHGESLGEHGDPTHSYSIYDATQHVPLLMAGPGVPAGRAVTQLVRLVDVTPTLLAAVGAAPFAQVDGLDLHPLLAGDPRGPGREAYMETAATRLDQGWSALTGLRTQRYGYIRAPRPELYDLESDPRELSNLASDSAARVAELDARLAERLEGLRDPAQLEMDAAQRRQLESLGYVAEGHSAPPAAELLAVGGVDPKDGLVQYGVVVDAISRLLPTDPAAALAMLESVQGQGAHLAFYRARAAQQAKRWPEAERYARDVIAARPEWSEGYVQLAWAQLGLGELDAARASVAEARRRDPDIASTWLVGGVIEETAGNRPAALAAYRHAAEGIGASSEAGWRLAVLEILDGRLDEADAVLAKLPHDAVDRAPVQLRLAAAEADAGAIDRAKQRLARACRQWPDDVALERLAAALQRDHP